MLDAVVPALTEVEAAEDVTILYACESGSRAWGFHSTDSDYDVRFLYLHRPSWYVSIDLENKRDVIERPIFDDLDISGWDLRKALRLLRKSNPPLLEWLDSPIVYLDRHGTAERLRELATTCFSPTACGYHYLHMARGNYREFLQGDTVRLKKYLYVLRPLLAVRWIESELGPVPMKFETLVAATLSEQSLIAAIGDLITRKAEGSELDRGPRVGVINEFIETELRRLGETPFGRSPPPPPVEPLDALFREQLDVVHGQDGHRWGSPRQ